MIKKNKKEKKNLILGLQPTLEQSEKGANDNAYRHTRTSEILAKRKRI
jgi:hypothetical protein